MDPTIADVHTDPADGLVLHVATGVPRLMVVTADGCTGSRAYAGLVSSYYEVLGANLTRYTEDQWSSQLMASPAPADVTWMQSLLPP